VEQAPPAIEWGTVISVLPAHQAEENSGAGAVAGVVLGAAAGAAIGGRGAAQVIGAVVGGLAGGAGGAAAESATRSPTGIAYTIRLLDGRVVTIVEHLRENDPVFAVGSQIAVTTRGRTQHVTAAAAIN